MPVGPLCDGGKVSDTLHLCLHEFRDIRSFAVNFFFPLKDLLRKVSILFNQNSERSSASCSTVVFAGGERSDCRLEEMCVPVPIPSVPGHSGLLKGAQGAAR